MTRQARTSAESTNPKRDGERVLLIATDAEEVAHFLGEPGPIVEERFQVGVGYPTFERNRAVGVAWGWSLLILICSPFRPSRHFISFSKRWSVSQTNFIADC